MSIYQAIIQIESQVGGSTTNMIVVSGGLGSYYLNSNPSGFITGIDTSNLMTVTGANAVVSGIQVQISGVSGNINNCIKQNQTGIFLDLNSGILIENQLAALTNQFYPLAQNPSGYITSGTLNSITGNLQPSGNYLNINQTGQFLPSNSGTLIQSEINLLSGNLVATGNLIENQIIFLSGINNSISGNLNLTGQNLLAQISGTGAFTGLFYPLNQNPANYLTSGSLSGLATLSELNQTGTNLLNLITIISGQTGQLTGQFGALSVQLQNVSNINNLTGNSGLYLTKSGASGLYYPLSQNPSGYITSGNFTGLSGAIQNQINNINLNTGNFLLQSQTGLFLPSTITGSLITGTNANSYSLLGYIKNVTVLTVGLAQDTATIPLITNKAYVQQMIVVSQMASGSLGATVFAAYDTSNGGGNQVASATTLSLLITTNKVQGLTIAYNGIVTTSNLYLRQTSLALFAGTVNVYCYGINLNLV